jgi:hypothetical protein
MAMSLVPAARGWVILEAITLSSGWDLRRTEDRQEAQSYVACERPDVIAAAWPCTSFSPMQNIMKNWPGHQEKLARLVLEAMPLVEFSSKLAEIQLASGRRFWGENPLTSRAWRTRPGQKMMNILYPVLPTCATPRS